MTVAPTPAAAGPGDTGPKRSVAARLAVEHRLGGLGAPIMTTVLAFLMGGIVVAATGHNPVTTYYDIIKGAGFNWLGHPWRISTVDTAPYNFTQTLIWASALALTGLAVSFAFRCGLFNIGGQGQFLVGLIVANWVGVSLPGLWGPLHVFLAIVASVVAGAVWGGIAGILKATVGAHEVISTIMLNWIALWLGVYLVSPGGPLQNTQNVSNPFSATVSSGAQLPVFWGDPGLQGLHVGFFIAVAMLVVFALLLNRTTLGYEVRAVGFNPDAAAYGGINVKRSYFLAMAISGAFAGLGGGVDMLGWRFGFSTSGIQNIQVGFLGIAVALLGRNTAIGVGLASLLFGGLVFGTGFGLDSAVIKPELASNLTSMIQGFVVLFVGADVLILYLWNRGLRRRRA